MRTKITFIFFLIIITQQLHSQNKMNMLIYFLDTIDNVQILKDTIVLENLKIKKVAVIKFDYGIKEYFYSNEFISKNRSLNLIIVTFRIFVNSVPKETILYKEVFYKNKNNKIDLKLKNYSTEYDSINEIFKKSHNKNLNLENDVVHFWRNYEFGYACGEAGEIPYYGKEMEKLIDNSNYFELENWIKSTNPIKLAYGYVGFKILEKKGYELTTEQIKLMLEISEKDYLDLNVCATCVYHDKLTLQEIINWDDTMYFIKNYSKK